MVRFLYFLLFLALPKLVAAQPVNRQLVTELADLQAIFTKNNVGGAFLLYDVTANQCTAYHADECGRGTLPASTVKIVNTLIGLETGQLTGLETVIPWDSITRDVPAWNKSHNLESAFMGSVVPYYQELARRIGLKNMRAYLGKINYGKMVVTTQTLDQFWLSGPSSVSLFGQVDFLRTVLAGTVPFSAKNWAVLRQVMRTDSLADGRKFIFATKLITLAPMSQNWLAARRLITLECLKKWR
ncbi:MAG TPA: penicillin-binding transpeptidase domain-containing protein [Fibrella sp.]